MGVEYLIQLGHRSIGFVGAALDIPFGREVWVGYLDAMAAADLAIDPHFLVTGDFTMEGTAHAVDQLFELAHRPSAIFAVSDVMAVGVMRAAQLRGIVIPDDLALASMDDVQLATFVDPPLTTVRIDRFALGTNATEMLIGLIRRTYSSPRKITLPPELVIRGSSGGGSRLLAR
jgi:DNA-binding LacI/PurR family transcriptional regulator